MYINIIYINLVNRITFDELTEAKFNLEND